MQSPLSRLKMTLDNMKWIRSKYKVRVRLIFQIYYIFFIRPMWCLGAILFRFAIVNITTENRLAISLQNSDSRDDERCKHDDFYRNAIRPWVLGYRVTMESTYNAPKTSSLFWNPCPRCGGLLVVTLYIIGSSKGVCYLRPITVSPSWTRDHAQCTTGTSVTRYYRRRSMID